MRVRIWIPCGTRGAEAYARALRALGAEVIELPAASFDGAVPAVLDAADGVLLPGGPDLAPRVYGEDEAHPTVEVDAARDRMDLGLCRGALARGIPVLGVCRGVQVLNVAAGGTLWQDLPGLRPGSLLHMEGPGRDRRRRLHLVQTRAGTRTAAALRSGACAVNSIHHQAVRGVAPRFLVGAVAPDGVVEAVEGPGPTLALGVQWHPEELWEADPRHAALFAALYAAARWHAAQR
jgi:putative glutamine amidotransferase